MSEIKKNWLRKVLKAQLFLFIAVLLFMLGNKFSILPFSLAFLGFTLSLLLIVILGVLGLFVLGFSLSSKFQSFRANAIKAIVIGFTPIAVIVIVVGPSGFSAPLIHDITTDFDNPPVFQHASGLRTSEENSTDYDRESLVTIQKNAYPEIAAITTALMPEEAFNRAINIAERRGWEIVAKDDDSLVIEAIEKTSFFGFTDDVVIRVSKTSEGSRVDLRSSSRVGQGDFGANAKRIIAFQKDFLNTIQE